MASNLPTDWASNKQAALHGSVAVSEALGENIGMIAAGHLIKKAVIAGYKKFRARNRVRAGDDDAGDGEAAGGEAGESGLEGALEAGESAATAAGEAGAVSALTGEASGLAGDIAAGDLTAGSVAEGLGESVAEDSG